MIVFDWDERKNRANQRKHGITFEEARSAFFNEDAVEFADPDHSADEDRYLLIGTRLLHSTRQEMRKEYDFANMKGRRNPYAKALKKQITIRLGVDILAYFKELSKETGIPYQNLIDLYLRDCMVSGRKPSLKWAS